MSQNKVVSIKSHPKYRDVAALRRYLAEGQDDFGTPVHISHILDLKAPELQEQLSELNAWAEALQGLTPISMTDPNAMPMDPNDEITVNFDFSHYRNLNLSHGPNVGKSIPMGPLLEGLLKDCGDRPVDWGNIRAIPATVLPTRGEFYEANHIKLDYRYMVKGSDDANPST